MGTRYRTANGIELELGRVDRQTLDRLGARYEAPKPPTRTVEAWGEIEEELPILDDPDYLLRMSAHSIKLAREQSYTIAQAIMVLSYPPAVLRELDDLAALGLMSDDTGIQLAVIPDDDMSSIVAEILYQSTVTERGIDEAARAFCVMWMDRPVTAWRVPSSPAAYSLEFEARMVATIHGYTWSGFCGLSGPEQSAEVCHWRTRNKIEWLEAEHERRRSRRKTR